MGERLLPTGFTRMDRSIVADQNRNVELFRLRRIPIEDDEDDGSRD
jgi:hypothetical protein